MYFIIGLAQWWGKNLDFREIKILIFKGMQNEHI